MLPPHQHILEHAGAAAAEGKYIDVLCGVYAHTHRYGHIYIHHTCRLDAFPFAHASSNASAINTPPCGPRPVLCRYLNLEDAMGTIKYGQSA